MTARPHDAEEHLRITIPSRLEELEGIVETTEAFVSRHEKNEDRAYTVLLLASEAVTNAIEHGNALDESKQVIIDFWARNSCLEIWVEDQGDGFDRAAIPDPLTGSHLFAEGGRGIYLIEELADEVRYEQNGRRIGMLFALSAA